MWKITSSRERISTMTLQKEVFNAYRQHIESHMEENRKGAAVVRAALEHSALFRNGVIDQTIQIPKVFDEETMADFRQIAEITGRIFGKVIKEYREHEDFRKLFPFSRELEELILLPKPYDGSLPIARFDLFYNEDTHAFKFCEINTDGTAAMLRDLEMGKALINNPAHQAVIREFDLEPFELFDTFVDEFMKLYETYPKKKEDPNVLITDFLENATVGDFEEFARRFQKRGIKCEICDIRDLKFEDGVLYTPAGNRVDAVYRRAVTADIMDNYDKVSAFLDAVRGDAVFIAGAFDTQVIHTKWLFHVLHLERCKQILSVEERAFVEEHIPLTLEFSPEFISLEEVRARKDDFMLKPMDAYASKGIYAAGHEKTQEEWDRITGEYYGKGLICQEYCKQYLTDNIDFAWGDGEWHPFINMPGLYVYNGKLAGFLMRMACGENIIYAHQNERTVPVFTVKGRR